MKEELILTIISQGRVCDLMSVSSKSCRKVRAVKPGPPGTAGRLMLVVLPDAEWLS